MKKDKLKKVIEMFKRKKIVVVGDMMLDDYVIGEVNRISPEAPVPILNVTSEKFVLGGAANVCNNLSMLGAKVLSFSVLGNDADGLRLIDSLDKNEIDTSNIILSDERPTIVKKRILSNNQQLLRIDWEKKRNILVKHEGIILNALIKKIEEIDAIILSDYNKGVLTSNLSKAIIELANKNNVIVIVDPKPENVKNYLNATSITPNRKEAKECLEIFKIDNSSSNYSLLREKLKLNNLLLTRSEEGMSLLEGDFKVSIPTFAKEVYDVTGAGDTVISTYTLAATTGITWSEAAKVANTAAGVVVGKVGTSTVTGDEIIQLYGEIYNK